MGKQRTINSVIEFTGRALQTGKPSHVVCRPLKEGEGIVFNRVDLGDEPLRLKKAIFSNSFKRRSTIGNGKRGVQTIEHLLAALWGANIDNILIEVDAQEIPAMDGSALEFLRAFKKAGTKQQALDRQVIKITEEISASSGDRSIKIVPGEALEVTYFIDYKVPSIGQGQFNTILTVDTFEKEIAPARTFCLKREAILLFLMGLGRGATTNNTLIMGNKGPVKTNLRFSDEPVRHKILDLVGDLYMLGRPIIGKIFARKSGHALNAELLEKIYEKYCR